MNRDDILNYINSNNQVLLIHHYCMDMGKTPSAIHLFIQCLLLKQTLMEYCYIYAKSYYIKKYNILYNKQLLKFI